MKNSVLLLSHLCPFCILKMKMKNIEKNVVWGDEKVAVCEVTYHELFFCFKGCQFCSNVIHKIKF